MALTKEMGEQLEAFLQGVEDGKVSGERGYYETLYLDTVVGNTGEAKWKTERVVAREAIRYPELHGLLRQLVDRIARYNGMNISPLWANDEEHAGAGPARELALAGEADIGRYIQYLVTNDLNHEVNQWDDIEAILQKWGIGQNTYPLIVARWFAPGQHGQEQMQKHLVALKENFRDAAERDIFLAECARWAATHGVDKEEVNDLLSELFEEVQYWEEYEEEQGDAEDEDEDAVFGPVVNRFYELVAAGNTPAFADLLD